MSEVVYQLDDIDRSIINSLQGGFPLSDRPYADSADRLGIGEDELLERLQRLLQDNVLTRFGPLFNAEMMGGEFVLAALHAPEARYDEITQQVNAFSQVAHNYHREHDLNMWFVVAVDGEERAQTVLDEIEARTGCQVYAMPKLKEYYVGLRFEV